MWIGAEVQKLFVFGDIVEAVDPILFSSSNDLNIRVRFSKVKVPIAAANFGGEGDESVEMGLTIGVLFDADSSKGDGMERGEMLVEFIDRSGTLGISKEKASCLKGSWHVNEKDLQ